MFLPMFLYSLGVHGPIVHVRLAVVVKVSLLWMSHHGLFPVSKSIFFFLFLGSHLMHVLCLPQSQSLQESLCLEQSISKGYAYVEFQNDTDARIAKLWMNRVGFSTMLV